MKELEIFRELKKRILETYQKSFPYFQGDWKNFSSKDIRQLIDLIESELKERVSEKWIYTHLKPEINEKLPRKDMLDIFSRFVGVKSWESFVYENQIKANTEKEETTEVSKTSFSKNKNWYWLLILPFIGVGIYFFTKEKPKPKKIKIQNELTKEVVPTEEIKAYKISDNEKSPISIENSTIELENEHEKIVIESPYFEKKEIEVTEKQEVIYLNPEDYALVLKNYIHSDLKDWEDRKAKLEKILADDLEVIILLKDNLGAEYLNKDEFSGKLIVPTSETKKMKILNLETNENKEITFIRIQQL